MKPSIVAELKYPVAKGPDVGDLPGPVAKRVQEWLCLHGYSVTIDGEPGPATRAALGKFQSRNGIGDSVGYLGETTWRLLVAPMERAFVIPRANDPSGAVRSLRQIVKMLVGQHLAQMPREVGGDRREISRSK